MGGSQDRASVTTDVHHPIFARFFDRCSGAMERHVGAHRDLMLAGLSGAILEVGAGNGVNFGHYPPAVEEVVALEPERYMRRRARQAAAKAPVKVSVVAGVASPLPFESATFDAVVASLVLCTVPDLDAALGEIRRVLKAGGEMRFFEHVRSDSSIKSPLQVALDATRVWPLFGGGCHCSRMTPAAIAAAGFEVLELQAIDLGPSWWVTNPHVRGRAQAPVA